MKKVLLVGTIRPQSSASAAGVRTLGLIASLKRYNWDLKYFTHARDKPQYDDLGVECFSCPVNSDEFFNILKAVDPNVVIYDRFLAEEQFGWRVRKYNPDILHVIDTQDLHFLRAAREKHALAGNSIESTKNLQVPLSDESLLRELTAIKRADMTMVCSTYEQQLLIEQFGFDPEKIKLASFFYEPHGIIEKTFSKRTDFLMLGGFRHAPNRDSVVWMKDIWINHVRKRNRLPRAELHVYGSYPSDADQKLTSKSDGFIIKGEIKPELLYKKISQYKALVAPLRFGAGIKGKITDAWSVGTPVITTCIGSEGMSDNILSWGGMVRDDPKSFSLSMAQIYTDEELWNSCSLKGNEIFKERFSFDENAFLLNRDLITAQERKEFLKGQPKTLDECIIEYQSLKYNETFSKWLNIKDR
jgi:glycosyltransferase involved in cell wall biosynthesis